MLLISDGKQMSSIQIGF